MATLNKEHQQLNEYGEGRCSVPMWCNGSPAGFCDEPSYSNHKGGSYFEVRGDRRYTNGAYSGYVPALACPAHGGKTKEEVLNLCAYCKHNIAECNGNPKFGCGIGNDNVYECDEFEPKN